MRPLVPRQGWVFAVSMLSGLLALYFAGFLSIHVLRAVQSWQLILLPLVSLLVARQLFRGDARPWFRAIGCLGSQFILLALACALAGHFHDFSWDGMTSRSLFVREMASAIPTDRNPNPVLGHVLSAYAVQATGNWNAGKFVNLVFPVITFGLVLSSLRQMAVRGAPWLAAVAALNPVALCQISTFQVDGLLAGLLTSLLFSLGGLLQTGRFQNPDLLTAALSLLGLALAKTSGILYGGLIVVLFLAGFAVRTKNYRAVLRAAGIAAVFALVFGWLLRGALNYPSVHPGYIWEAISPRGLGYGYTPGGGASQIEEFAHSSKLKQFLASYFSYTEISPTEISWKPPFWLIRREIRVFEELTPDPRAGGFGPLYGTALLVGWGALLVALLSRSVRLEWCDWFLPVAVVATSFPSQVWWARWVPQLWLLALVPLVMIARSGRPAGRLTRALAGLSLATLAVNLGLILLYYGLGMVRAQRVLDSQLALLQQLPQPVSLFVPRFTANQYWLEDAGIEVKVVGEKPAAPRMKLVKTTSWVGLDPAWRRNISDPEIPREFERRNLLEE